MKYAIVAGLVSLGLFSAGVQAQEGIRNEAAISATGSFEQSTTAMEYINRRTSRPVYYSLTVIFLLTIKVLSWITASVVSISSMGR